MNVLRYDIFIALMNPFQKKSLRNDLNFFIPKRLYFIVINASTRRETIRNSTRIMKYCRLSRMLKLSNPADAYLSYITFDLVTRTGPYDEKNIFIYLLGFRT